MKRHKLFAAIVLSGLAVGRCGGEISDRDASTDDAAGGPEASSDGDAAMGFPDAAYEASYADAEADVDAFVLPPIITH